MTEGLAFSAIVSLTVQARLERAGQGVLQPSAGLAALAAIMRGLVQPCVGNAVAGAGGLLLPTGTTLTVNPFDWPRQGGRGGRGAGGKAKWGAATRAGLVSLYQI